MALVGINGEVKEVQTVPKDRSFRSAWIFDGDNVVVDMVKAADIHRDMIREERKTLFWALDIEYIKADEIEDKVAKDAIFAQKKKLRDAPADPRIANASTTDELKALTLDVLIGS